MFAGGSGEADLVVVCRCAGIRVVEMPVEDGIRTGVGSFEDKLLPFAGEAFRKIKDGVDVYKRQVCGSCVSTWPI